MTAAPSPIAPDSTLQLMRDPYRHISRTARHLGTDIFETRLMLEPALCLTGPEAAAFFYRSGALRRRGATPPRFRNVLFGKGGVQGLDGAAHRNRKAMLLSLMSEASLDDIVRRFDGALADLLPRWRRQGDVDLYAALRKTLMAAVCDWAGLPLSRGETCARAEEMSDLFEHAAGVGPAYWRGRQARRRANLWAEAAIEGLRTGEIRARPEAPARVVAEARDEGGALLPRHVAAVDLLNLVRPNVAIAVYGVFCAHALHRHPDLSARVRGDAAYRTAFVQEVRRLYPFFPAVAAVAARPTGWRGVEIPKGRRLILDLYGTNRDPRAWQAPDAFRPERFLGWPGNPFTMVPQGGGDHWSNHRCAGEWMTIRLMERICELLTGETRVAARGDPEPDFGALPALPRSGGFVLQDAARPA